MTAGVGTGAWIAVAAMGGRREAWDSPLYFTLALPAIALAVAAVSYLVPVRVWRWAMFPFWAQAVTAFLQNPGANLLPLGLIVFSIFGAVFLLPANIAAQIGRRRAAP